MTERQELLQFPCRFPLKIMGKQHESFQMTIIEVVRTHAPDVSERDVQSRDSSSGKYASLTVTVTATSREQLDNIYRSLTSHPMVKVVF